MKDFRDVRAAGCFHSPSPRPRRGCRRLKTGLDRAAASVPVLKVDEERWDGDRMIFRVRALGQAAAGHVDVEDDHVRVEVTLPWLLQRFAEVAQAAIKKRGRLLLTKRD